MTPEEAARIVEQSRFPRSGSLDDMIETMEALLIHVDRVSPDEARARGERYRETIERAQGIRRD